MDFSKIVEKHGYSDELANFLKQVYDEFVLEFGPDSEKIIYMAFYEVPVIDVGNIYDGVKKYDLYRDVKGTIVKDDDLKRASGCNSSKPDYENNTVKRAVLIKNLDLNDSNKKATLIHELGHLIKGYLNEYKLDNGIEIQRSGLIETIVKVDENGFELLLEKGVGLEEGLNSILERKITRKLVDPTYEIHGYGVVTKVGETFIDLCGQDIVNNAQIFDKKAELIAMFNERYGLNAYERFELVADKLYRIGLDVFANIFEPEKMQKYAELQKSVIENEYIPLVKELRTYALGGR